MSWEISEQPPTPAAIIAVYYLVLPSNNEVLHSTELVGMPTRYMGDYTQFVGSLLYGTPLIPLDTHHALLLDWVDMDEMSRNRPYMDDAIKAAIALVA